jgi:hypothetical protein
MVNIASVILRLNFHVAAECLLELTISYHWLIEFVCSIRLCYVLTSFDGSYFIFSQKVSCFILDSVDYWKKQGQGLEKKIFISIFVFF